MLGYDTYRIYLSLQLHFKEGAKYDYWEYEGKVSATLDSFKKRKDRYFFQRLEKRFNGKKKADLVKYIIANYRTTGAIWIGELVKEQAMKNYKEFVAKENKFTYNFKSEVTHLVEDYDFNYIFKSVDGNAPLVYDLANSEISIETFLILDELLEFVNSIEVIDPEYNKTVSNWLKYKAFLFPDYESCREILINVLEENNLIE